MQDVSANILLIDDEVNIVNALKRLLRVGGWQITGANNGLEALAFAKTTNFDLVICDMRMPGMDGVETLEQIAALQPDCIRLLLTGYADVKATIDAINRGKILRYISKPWQDEEILSIVRDALIRRELTKENHRLQLLTEAQNKELKSLNESLEQKVKDRTAELEQTVKFLDLSQQNLRLTFERAAQTFANLIELRSPQMAGHAQRVCDEALKIAHALKLSDEEIDHIKFAALLHDVGKIGLSDDIITKPIVSLQPDQVKMLARHTQKGQSVLMNMDSLRRSGEYIHAHHERFDGQGFPLGLKGEEIPLGARILLLAEDFDELQMGLVSNKKLSHQEAVQFILSNKGRRYDPLVVDAWHQETQKDVHRTPVRQRFFNTDQLKSGMRLSQPLTSKNGILLLAKDFLLDDILIRQLKEFERTEGHLLDVAVYE